MHSSLSHIAELPFGQMSHHHQSSTLAQINHQNQSPAVTSGQSGQQHHHYLHTTSTEFIPTDSAEAEASMSRSHPDLNIDKSSQQCSKQSFHQSSAQRSSPDIVEAPLAPKAAVATSWSGNLQHFEAHSLSSGGGSSDQRDSLDDAEGQGQGQGQEGVKGHHHHHSHLNTFRKIKSGIEHLVEHLPALVHHSHSSHNAEDQHLKEMGIEEEHEQQEQQQQQHYQQQQRQQQFSSSTSSTSSGNCSGGEVTLATIESGQGQRTGSVDHENMFQQSFSTIVEMSAELQPEVNFHQRLGQAFADVEELPDPDSKEGSPDRETRL